MALMKPSQLNDSSVSEAIATPTKFLKVNLRNLGHKKHGKSLIECLPRTTGARDNHSVMGMDCPIMN